MRNRSRTIGRLAAALVLVLALCCPALAGEIQTTLTAGGGTSTTAAGQMPGGVAGDMGNGVSLTEVVLALLQGVLALP